MNVANVRCMVAGLAMVATAAIALAITPGSKQAETFPDLERIIRPQFGAWRIDPSMVPIPPAPNVRDRLKTVYDAIVSRTYVNDGGQRMMLTVAYAGQQSHTSEKIHRQEGCYESQGFTIAGLTHDSINIGSRHLPAIRMVATRGTRVEPVTYWFRTGRWVSHTHAGRFVAFLQGITGEIPDGVLVRISSLSTDASGSFALHDAFVRELLQSMVEHDARYLVGNL